MADQVHLSRDAPGPAGQSTSEPSGDGPVWHTLSADRVLQAEEVDDHVGLSSAEAASRAQRFGPNKFDTATIEPRWRAFIRQYADPMQIILPLPRKRGDQHAIWSALRGR